MGLLLFLGSKNSQKFGIIVCILYGEREQTDEARVMKTHKDTGQLSCHGMANP